MCECLLLFGKSIAALQYVIFMYKSHLLLFIPCGAILAHGALAHGTGYCYIKYPEK